MSDRRGKSAPNPSERRIHANDRRLSVRHPSRGTAAVIGWGEGDAHRTTPASLIDISMGGFSAWVETSPPRGGPVWLRLDGDDTSPWLKASVVTTARTGCLFWTRLRVSFRFLESCPYDLFKGAIQGFTRESHHRARAREGGNRRWWRRGKAAIAADGAEPAAQGGFDFDSASGAGR
jgi:hypothetical protein